MSVSLSEDIRTYLQIFAKNIGLEIERYSPQVDGIVENIIARFNQEIGTNVISFEQNIPPVCKKCRLKYTEQGSITNKSYSYCINSGVVQTSIPVDCPKNNKGHRFIVEKIDDDSDLISIRKRGRV